MVCYRPIEAWKAVNKDGSTSIVFRLSDRTLPTKLYLPCGGCVGCRLEYSKQWGVRVMHEAQMHPENCFITLTYNDDYLPEDGSLVKIHFTNFLKRLRKKYGAGLKFYMCGEYGEETGRPHYHSIIFGHGFLDDRVYLKTTPSGEKIYKSASLQALWTDPKTKEDYGYATVGDVTFKSACYVARYVMKKWKGDVEKIKDHYQGKVPEYGNMSRGGKDGKGLGYSWFMKYKDDLYPSDECIVEGRKVKIPRYYDELRKELEPKEQEKTKRKRIRSSRKHKKDNTSRRLKDREVCHEARANRLRKDLE